MKYIRPERWLSTREVGRRLGLGVRTVRLLISEGVLPAQRHRGRTLRILESDLEAYMAGTPPVETEGNTP